MLAAADLLVALVEGGAVMHEDYDQVPGWPAQSTAVRKDERVLFSPPLTAEDREHEKLRMRRYRDRIRQMQCRTRRELAEMQKEDAA